MNSVWYAAMIVAALLLTVTMFLAVRGSRRRTPPDPGIEAMRAKLRQLSSRAEQGELSADALEEQRLEVARDMLEAHVSVAGSSQARSSRLGRFGSAVIAVLCVAVLYVGVRETRTSAPALGSAAPSASQSAGEPAHALSEEQLHRMVEQAQDQVKRNAKDVSAWAMIAHSHDMLGEFSESAKAYAKLAELLPDDAQVLADYADALAVAQGRVLTGEPRRLIDRALALDASNLKALTLAGTEAFERKSYAGAARYWERARRASGDPAITRQIDSSIDEAKLLAGETVTAGAGEPARGASQSPSSSAGSVSGRVSVAAGLTSSTSPEDVVFIFARPVQGSRMPVALMRKHVRDLPLDFTLDDTMAMVPEQRLSKFVQVVVGARVSKRGDAMPQAGDLQGFTSPVSVGSRGLKLEISEAVP
ncbi:MAG: c-type cytochrome biogenesis protein CcmI [Burkholderiales bacterium]